MLEDRAPVEEILAAHKRTVSRGSARIEFRYEVSFHFDKSKHRRNPRQGDSPLRRLSRRWMPALIELLASGMIRLFTRGSRKVVAPRAFGVIDFTGQRCMYGYPRETGQDTVLVVRDEEKRGTPGSNTHELSAEPASALQPLWLFDLVRGVVDATELTAETLDGHPCRYFKAQADLNRVAEVVSYELAIPSGMDRLGDASRIPTEVWVDDHGHIRRIRHTTESNIGPKGNATLDLTEFGIELPSDWSRLLDLAADGGMH